MTNRTCFRVITPRTFGVTLIFIGLLGCSGSTDGVGTGGSSAIGGGTSQGGAAGGLAGTTGTTNCACVRGAYVPVCGTDGKTYDATCGDVCVPVAIACRGQCPCQAGTGGATVGGAASTGGALGTGGSTSTACNQNCVAGGFVCCDTACRNTDNDPTNCGACGTVCPSSTPVCQSGHCVAINCTAELGPSGAVCCGAAWCTSGQMCCMVSGPVVSNVPSCLNPVDGTCPRGCKLCVCANPDTPIDTPHGQRKISDLNLGDLVYSVDHEQIVAVPIIDIRRRPALGHVVPQIALSNGQILQISDQHPTADGRIFGELHEGDSLGGLRIVSVDRVTYEQPYTYDILPASDTGHYFAGGAMIGSTLAPSPASHYYRPVTESVGH